MLAKGVAMKLKFGRLSVGLCVGAMVVAGTVWAWKYPEQPATSDTQSSSATSTDNATDPPPGMRRVVETKTKLVNYTVLKPLRESHQKEIQYTIMKPVYETREKTVTYTVCTLVPETRTKVCNYTTVKMVPETKQKEIVYTEVSYLPIEAPR